MSCILIDCLRVMEKKSNVVIKPSTSMGDATQDEEDVAIATPVSVESEVPLSEQGVMELCLYALYMHCMKIAVLMLCVCTYVHT